MRFLCASLYIGGLALVAVDLGIPATAFFFGVSAGAIVAYFLHRTESNV